jgi:hypothetical protein
VLNCVPDVKDIDNVASARCRSVVRAKRDRAVECFGSSILGRDCAPYQGANRFMRWAKLRTSCNLSLAKLTAVVEPVEGDFSILADLDEVAVGFTHIAAPFPAVIV